MIMDCNDERMKREVAQQLDRLEKRSQREGKTFSNSSLPKRTGLLAKVGQSDNASKLVVYKLLKNLTIQGIWMGHMIQRRHCLTNGTNCIPAKTSL